MTMMMTKRPIICPDPQLWRAVTLSLMVVVIIIITQDNYDDEDDDEDDNDDDEKAYNMS